MKAIVFLSSYDLQDYLELYERQSVQQPFPKEKIEFYSEDQSPINLVNLTKHSQYLINKDIEKRRMDYINLSKTKRFLVWGY
jgi:hypothetical protein